MLKRRGADRVGLCPFHEDREPSLVVTPAKNLWHCFGCGLGGGVIDWVMKADGVSFRHAVELLKEGSPALAAVSVDVNEASGPALPSAPIKRSTVRPPARAVLQTASGSPSFFALFASGYTAANGLTALGKSRKARLKPARCPLSGTVLRSGSSLHYNYFRDYDPATGRYVQSDPIGLRGGVNEYIYVNANPLVWIDLLGLIVKCKFFPYSDMVNKGKATGRTRETWFSHIDETIISLPHPMGLPGALGVMWKIKYTQKGILEAEYEAFKNGVTTCYDECGNIVDKYWNREKFIYGIQYGI